MKAPLIYFSISSLLGAGSVGFFALRKDPPPPVTSHFSASGRDAALMALIQSAKKSVFVRTSLLDCAPIANALLQKQQNGVPIYVELPLRGNANTETIVNALAQVGGHFELSSDSSISYEGAYILVDGTEWLYSASPLNYAPPGIPRSFVRGRKGSV